MAKAAMLGMGVRGGESRETWRMSGKRAEYVRRWAIAGSCGEEGYIRRCGGAGVRDGRRAANGTLERSRIGRFEMGRVGGRAMGLVWQIGGGTKEWKGRGPADGRGDGMLQTRAAVAVSRQGAFVAPALPFFRQYACAPWASIPVPPTPSSGVPSLVSCLSLTSSRHFSPRPQTLSVLPTLLLCPTYYSFW